MKNYYFLLLFFLIFKINFLAVIVVGLKMERIIGGELARENEFNYLVSVQENGKHVCGGGIIHDFFILSAAHCFFNIHNESFIESDFSVILATTNILNLNNVTRIPIRKVYIPQIYAAQVVNLSHTQTVQADISILELKDSLYLYSNLWLTKLKLVEPSFSHQRKIYRIAGYGYNVIQNDGSGSTDGKLRHAEAEAVSNHILNKDIPFLIHGTNMCARVKQRNPNIPEGVCTGDGGSPLIYKDNYVAGILFASSVECKENRAPSIYSRISNHLKFIANVLERKRTSDIRVAERKRIQAIFRLQELSAMHKLF